MDATVAPYPGGVFGRTKTPLEVATDPVTDGKAGDLKNGSDVKSGGDVSGKGRPTPKRREAEQANRRPLIGSSAVVKASQDLAKAGTKEERKAAKAAQREAMGAARARQRQALANGDEAHLPARDKGPVRRYARDFVDSRRWVGEVILVPMLVVVFIGLTQPKIAVVVAPLMYLVILAVLFDFGRVRKGLKRGFTAKFGPDGFTRKDVTYGMMRTVQLRRFRLPKPQVQRGQHPS
jgi:hypothetical protein